LKVQPLEDRIVIKTNVAQEATASGIIIPDSAQEKPQEGEVVAVGPGRVGDDNDRIPMEISVGDSVIYSKYGGTEIEVDGEEFTILSSRDVLAIIV
jgi:chaperonin GroES